MVGKCFFVMIEFASMLSSNLLSKPVPNRSTTPRALLELLYCSLVKMAFLYTAQYCVMYKIYYCKY